MLVMLMCVLSEVYMNNCTINRAAVLYLKPGVKVGPIHTVKRNQQKQWAFCILSSILPPLTPQAVLVNYIPQITLKLMWLC